MLIILLKTFELQRAVPKKCWNSFHVFGFKYSFKSRLLQKKDIKFTGLISVCLTFTGVPFVLVGTKMLDCHWEKDWNVRLKERDKKKSKVGRVRKQRLCFWYWIILKGTVKYKFKETSYTFSYSVNNSFYNSQV